MAVVAQCVQFWFQFQVELEQNQFHCCQTLEDWWSEGKLWTPLAVVREGGKEEGGREGEKEGKREFILFNKVQAEKDWNMKERKGERKGGRKGGMERRLEGWREAQREG